MPYTIHPPNTVVLSGRAKMVVIGGVPAGEADIKPGMHVEQFSDSGVLSWRKHSSTTKMLPPYIAIEHIDNKGIDDAYDLGSECLVGTLENGMTYYPLVPSGQDITTGDYLGSNGAGLVVETADADATDNVAKAQALETLGAITVETRCRTQWNG